MAGKRFALVGRYMEGNEVVGYHLTDLENNQGKRYSREQMCFLVGAGRVENCGGQLNKDEVIIRGKNGLEINSLPVVKRDGSLSRSEAMGPMRKSVPVQQALEQYIAVRAVTQGRNTVGYILRNAAGLERYVVRSKVIEMASKGRIRNLRVQSYGNKPLLRGDGSNLNNLPSVSLAEVQAAGGATDIG